MRLSAICSFLAVVALLSVARAEEVSYTTIEGHGGVPLVVAEAGNPRGLPILFIHGFSQSLLSWKYQLADAELQRKYRLIAVDLRGHGASAKPWQPDAYRTPALGGDIQAVISAKALDRPVLVGWSYGGEVIMSYIRHHGTAQIRGVVFVAAGTSLDGPVQVPDVNDPQFAQRWAAFTKMIGPDLAANITGTRLFVASLTSQPLSPADNEEAPIYNMLTPAYARSAMHYVPDNSDLVGRVDIPTLIIHGDKDAIAPHSVSVTSEKLIKGSRLLTYRNIGHAPFLETPARFNSDIAAFVAGVPTSSGSRSALASFFGNTWVYTADDGTKYVYLNADGSFAIVVQNGALFRGHWTLDGRKVCFHVAGDTPSCFTDLVGRKVAVAWNGAKPEKSYKGILHEGRPNLIAQDSKRP